MEVRDALTSTFVSASASEMQVSRVGFSGPARGCVRRLVQGVRGEKWPVGCGFELRAVGGGLAWRGCVCMHRACIGHA